MSITSLLMTALMAFVLLVPALMVAVLASGVPLQAASDDRRVGALDPDLERDVVAADLQAAA
jgi:hypothetical protein